MVICRLVVKALGGQSIRFKGVAVGIELWGFSGWGSTVRVHLRGRREILYCTSSDVYEHSRISYLRWIEENGFEICTVRTNS